MIRSLFVSMQELNKGARRPADVPAKPIKKIGVLGAGFMGAGIAYVSAQAGIDVVLIDRDQETADKGKAHSQKLITDQINRGRATDRRPRRPARAHHGDAGLCGARRLRSHRRSGVRGPQDQGRGDRQGAERDRQGHDLRLQHLDFADQLARDTLQGPRAFRRHSFLFAGRPHDAGRGHSGQKDRRRRPRVALDYVRAIRKTPIVVNDSRGFYTSRVVGTYIREGHLMLAEGVPAAMIENVGRMAGMPVGPLSLNDEVAVDLAWKILKATEADLGPDAIDVRQKSLLEEMVEKRGRYGRKNGKGFYDYPQSGPKRLWPGLAELQATKLDPDSLDVEELKTRLLAIQALEIGALRRGRRRHRYAGSRRRVHSRLRLRAIHRRYDLLYRRYGHCGLRRAVQRLDQALRRAV